MEMNDFEILMEEEFLKGNKVVITPFYDEIELFRDSWTWNYLPTSSVGNSRCNMIMH